MEHPTCKTCKHFGEKLDNWDNPLGLHHCRMVAEHWEMSKWDKGRSENMGKPEFAGHLASVNDGSMYKAYLNVHPDFYCAMHSDLMPDLTPYMPT